VKLARIGELGGVVFRAFAAFLSLYWFVLTGMMFLLAMVMFAGVASNPSCGAASCYLPPVVAIAGPLVGLIVTGAGLFFARGGRTKLALVLFATPIFGLVTAGLFFPEMMILNFASMPFMFLAR
jgi:hypothetical protein